MFSSSDQDYLKCLVTASQSRANGLLI
jgi:hypothetical protein